jgi:hypothetical protein
VYTFLSWVLSYAHRTELKRIWRHLSHDAEFQAHDRGSPVLFGRMLHSRYLSHWYFLVLHPVLLKNRCVKSRCWRLKCVLRHKCTSVSAIVQILWSLCQLYHYYSFYMQWLWIYPYSSLSGTVLLLMFTCKGSGVVQIDQLAEAPKCLRTFHGTQALLQCIPSHLRCAPWACFHTRQFACRTCQCEHLSSVYSAYPWSISSLVLSESFKTCSSSYSAAFSLTLKAP